MERLTMKSLEERLTKLEKRVDVLEQKNSSEKKGSSQKKGSSDKGGSKKRTTEMKKGMPYGQYKYCRMRFIADSDERFSVEKVNGSFRLVFKGSVYNKYAEDKNYKKLKDEFDAEYPYDEYCTATK